MSTQQTQLAKMPFSRPNTPRSTEPTQNLTINTHEQYAWHLESNVQMRSAVTDNPLYTDLVQFWRDREGTKPKPKEVVHATETQQKLTETIKTLGIAINQTGYLQKHQEQYDQFKGVLTKQHESPKLQAPTSPSTIFNPFGSSNDSSEMKAEQKHVPILPLTLFLHRTQFREKLIKGLCEEAWLLDTQQGHGVNEPVSLVSGSTLEDKIIDQVVSQGDLFKTAAETYLRDRISTIDEPLIPDLDKVLNETNKAEVRRTSLSSTSTPVTEIPPQIKQHAKEIVEGMFPRGWQTLSTPSPILTSLQLNLIKTRYEQAFSDCFMKEDNQQGTLPSDETIFTSLRVDEIVYFLTSFELSSHQNGLNSILSLPAPVSRAAKTFFLSRRMFLSAEDLVHLFTIRAFSPPRSNSRVLIKPLPLPQTKFDSINHSYNGPMPVHESVRQRMSTVKPLEEVSIPKFSFATKATQPAPTNPSDSPFLKYGRLTGVRAAPKKPQLPPMERKSNRSYSVYQPLGTTALLKKHLQQEEEKEEETKEEEHVQNEQDAVVSRVTALLCLWIHLHRQDFERPIVLYSINGLLNMMKESNHPYRGMLSSIVGGFLFDSFKETNINAVYKRIKEQKIRLKEQGLRALVQKGKIIDINNQMSIAEKREGLFNIMQDASHEWDDLDRSSTNIADVVFLSMLQQMKPETTSPPIKENEGETESTDPLTLSNKQTVLSLVQDLILNNPRLFARQLTIAELEMFLVVSSEEFVHAMSDTELKDHISNQVSTPPPFNPNYPNLSRLLNHVSAVTNCVSSLFSQANSSESSVESAVNVVIEACAECEGLHNWCAYKAIAHGLSKADLTGQYFSSLPAETTAKLDEIRKKGSPKGNYGALRRQMRGADKKVVVCIPCIEAYLFDLIIINDNLPNLIKGKVNYPKALNIRRCVDEIQLMIEHVEFIEAVKVDSVSQAILTAMESIDFNSVVSS